MLFKMVDISFNIELSFSLGVNRTMVSAKASKLKVRTPQLLEIKPPEMLAVVSFLSKLTSRSLAKWALCGTVELDTFNFSDTWGLLKAVVLLQAIKQKLNKAANKVIIIEFFMVVDFWVDEKTQEAKAPCVMT